jgi:citrate lyase subunit beta/citryl-CoA lyase
MLEKAENVPADVVLPDMEDSVPDHEKANARATIEAHLPRLAAGKPLLFPRVNSLETGWTEADLQAVVGPAIAGISIGKVGSAADISAVSNLMARFERNADLEPGSLKLIPWIETARAIVHCHEICIASKRIVGVAFGAEDFTNDMGIARLDDESQLDYARSTICVAARAAGIAALETPYFDFRNLQGLRASSIASKHLGFKGRFAIHPGQIETINACFSPSPEEIEWARRVVAAFEAAAAQGRGSTSLDGRVIDVPVVKRARALLALTDTRS